jgi:hypothetical protein
MQHRKKTRDLIQVLQQEIQALKGTVQAQDATILSLRGEIYALQKQAQQSPISEFLAMFQDASASGNRREGK